MSKQPDPIRQAYDLAADLTDARTPYGVEALGRPWANLINQGPGVLKSVADKATDAIADLRRTREELATVKATRPTNIEGSAAISRAADADMDLDIAEERNRELTAQVEKLTADLAETTENAARFKEMWDTEAANAMRASAEHREAYMGLDRLYQEGLSKIARDGFDLLHANERIAALEAEVAAANLRADRAMDTRDIWRGRYEALKQGKTAEITETFEGYGESCQTVRATMDQTLLARPITSEGLGTLRVENAESYVELGLNTFEGADDPFALDPIKVADLGVVKDALKIVATDETGEEIGSATFAVVTPEDLKAALSQIPAAIARGEGFDIEDTTAGTAWNCLQCDEGGLRAQHDPAFNDALAHMLTHGEKN